MKVCFVSHHFKNPTVYLQQIIKMTPGKTGKWKDMEAVTDPKKADYCVVFDGANVPVPDDRTLYFGEHPTCVPSYTEWPKIKAKAKFPLSRFLNPGEWWIDYDYDYLSQLTVQENRKNLVTVFTAHNYKHMPMYFKRVLWMRGFCQFYKKEFDIFGRPSSNFEGDEILKPFYRGVLGNANPNPILGEHQTGKERLVEYRHSIEFDQGPTVNYISERFYDAMLCWVMPFYFGSSNVHTYLPENSFRYINTEDTNPDYQAVVDVLESDFYEKHFSELAEARSLLLNKYQIWPYVYDAIKSL